MFLGDNDFESCKRVENILQNQVKVFPIKNAEMISQKETAHSRQFSQQVKGKSHILCTFIQICLCTIFSGFDHDSSNDQVNDDKLSSRISENKLHEEAKSNVGLNESVLGQAKQYL